MVNEKITDAFANYLEGIFRSHCDEDKAVIRLYIAVTIPK